MIIKGYKIILWVVIAVAIALALVSYFVLPEELRTPFTSRENPEIIDKLTGILCPLAVSLLFSAGLYWSKGKSKFLMLSLLGIVMGAAVLFTNL